MVNETMGTRDDLAARLQGAYLEDFHFAYEEDEDQALASLTNSAAKDLIALQDNENSLVIQYVHIKDKESDTDTTAKLELIRKDTDLSLVSTDVATGEVIKKIALPPPVRHDSDDHRAFETIEECIAEFDSSELHATLLAEANRSCESQLTHVTCCLTDGSCWSVVLVIEPSFLRCRFGVRLPRHPELEFYKE